MAGPDKKEQLASNESSPEADASSGEPAFSFHYDALDTLAGRSTSSGKEHRFYRNDELANEIQGGVSRTFLRAEGIVLAEQQTGERTPRLLAGDDKNSVLVEVSQDAIQAIAYSAYGHRVHDASVSSPLGYNGERCETQTGWYLLGNGYRVFNPLLMRFHSPDSLSPFGKGGLNAYMYCVGDPINNVDPTGHLVGSVLRLFRPTTTSVSSLKLRSAFIVNPHEKTRAATLKRVSKADVANLHSRGLARFKSANAALKELDELQRYGGGQEDIVAATKKFDELHRYAQLAADDHNYAEANLGKRRITQYSARKFKAEAKAYEAAKAAEQAEERAKFLDWKVNDDQRRRAVQRGPGEVRSYLGVDNMEKIRKQSR